MSIAFERFEFSDVDSFRYISLKFDTLADILDTPYMYSFLLYFTLMTSFLTCLFDAHLILLHDVQFHW